MVFARVAAVPQVSARSRLVAWSASCTESELAAVVAKASHAVTFAWDGAGIVVARLDD